MRCHEAGTPDAIMPRVVACCRALMASERALMQLRYLFVITMM